MTPMELRSSFTLASIFSLRLLGLFLVMPVFALEARKYPGGDDPALIGLAMGIYGLTQGLLQIPFGMASDRFGRKRVILFGLIVFALGSLYAGCADSLWELLVGRALQGAGAVSAAVTALLADQTRDVVRTKALALVSAGIGLMFALSLVVAPLLVAHIGLAGLFFLTAVLAVMGMAVVVWAVPPAPAVLKDAGRGGLRQVLSNPALLRLNIGVFVLNAVQLAMWVVVPALLVQAGWVKDDHWQIYLPAVLGSFVVMGGVFPLERRGYLRAVFLSAIALLAFVQLALLWVSSGSPSIMWLAWLLFAFFCGFNVLEATQPSMVSRIAPASSRGAAMGIYNTLQSLGFFVGGLMGGQLAKSYGTQGLFLTCAALMVLWLVVAWPMVAPQRAAPSVTPHN
ncbi:MFS transporter [Limnohabitans sp. B9-3]|uniref:MFS transporter n=1 Tax=Limnohabitans sp. B9-3 TaxID=1100707 RepID=UPI000C1ECC2B|nr:MFS transporter [Limnohabitans sp. B9-3]PIT71752.1 MFS transporter [Limnohabitans sp. B9-3]